ncbi:hypothetical protein BCR39DRAFT_585654 [Naematelia encephala]|uniref:Uncharacterized protein n=1 Tax=Naematelia encephala TaxID=71784 RepID=A0A1Y2BKS6_9TREE|nr:hypothetical protein BCR39DRAFT_585654 [Naematelia encephala]
MNMVSGSSLMPSGNSQNTVENRWVELTPDAARFLQESVKYLPSIAFQQHYFPAGKDKVLYDPEQVGGSRGDSLLSNCYTGAFLEVNPSNGSSAYAQTSVCRFSHHLGVEIYPTEWVPQQQADLALESWNRHRNTNPVQIYCKQEPIMSLRSRDATTQALRPLSGETFEVENKEGHEFSAKWVIATAQGDLDRRTQDLLAELQGFQACLSIWANVSCVPISDTSSMRHTIGTSSMRPTIGARSSGQVVPRSSLRPSGAKFLPNILYRQPTVPSALLQYTGGPHMPRAPSSSRIITGITGSQTASAIEYGPPPPDSLYDVTRAQI